MVASDIDGLNVSSKTPEGARFRPRQPNPAQLAHEKKVTEVTKRIETLQKRLVLHITGLIMFNFNRMN